MLAPKPEDTYLKGAAFGTMVAKERLDLLDKEGMAKTVLYPTIGLLWEAELFDAELSAAYCKAYNRWIADFCRDSGGRLVPIAHLSLGDPAEAARELERAVKDGCKGAFVCPFTITRVPHGDPRSRRGLRRGAGSRRAARDSSDLRAGQLRHPSPLRQFRLGRMVLRSVRGPGRAACVRHVLPVRRLRPLPEIAALWCSNPQAGWIGYFLDRGDAIFNGTTLGATVRLKEKPSYYFKRQCYISADPDERTIAAMMDIVGEDKFFWATDYPHPDHPGNYLEELKGHDRANEGVGPSRHPRRECRTRIPAHVAVPASLESSGGGGWVYAVLRSGAVYIRSSVRWRNVCRVRESATAPEPRAPPSHRWLFCSRA